MPCTLRVFRSTVNIAKRALGVIWASLNKPLTLMDPNDLTRFMDAQEGVCERALEEIRHGRKQSHWMWFIFPQVDGLGTSATAKYYSIKSKQEAREYLQHPVLGGRLNICAHALLDIRNRTASEIMGSPDDMKLKSSMTLFATISGAGPVFHLVLDKYFQGRLDQKTLEILASELSAT